MASKQHLHRIIDELSDAQAAEAEVLLVALLRNSIGAAAPDEESLTVGLYDALAEIAAIEADVPEDVRRAWLEKLDHDAEPIVWDDAKGEFVEVGT
jgi:hypothetical protein